MSTANSENPLRFDNEPVHLKQRISQFVKCVRSLLESRDERSSGGLSSYFGGEFLDVIREAPAEYALLTAMAHVSIWWPWALTRGKFKASFPDESPGKAGDFGIRLSHPTKASSTLPEFCELYERIFHPLATTLAAANQSACQFRVFVATSWHAIAIQYLAEAAKCVENAFVRLVQRMGSEDALVKAALKHVPRMIEVNEPCDAMRLFELELSAEIADVLRERGIAVSEGELRTLAVQLQQELPRAWSFKYAQSDFVRLDETTIEGINDCLTQGRAVAPRLALFQKWKEKEGLGPTRIARKWNDMPLADRRVIAPFAYGNVEAPAVKKALEREKRRRKGESKKMSPFVPIP